MNNNDYVNADPTKSNGGLFPNQYKQGNGPDMKGYVPITGEQVKMIIRMSKMGLQPKLQLSAWQRQSQNGGTFLSLEAQTYISDKEVSSTAAPVYTPPEQTTSLPPAAAQPNTGDFRPPAEAQPNTGDFSDFDDDVPF